MSTTMLKSLLAQLSVESAEVAVMTETPEVPATGADDASLAEQVVAEVIEIDAAVDEHDEATETVQALEGLALALEHTVQSGRGYTALEMALHHSAVSAHYKLLGLAAPSSPSLESFASPSDREHCSTLALEDLKDGISRVVKAIVEFVKNICKKVGEYFAKLGKLFGFKSKKAKAVAEAVKHSKPENSSGVAPSGEVSVKHIGDANPAHHYDTIDHVGELINKFCSGAPHSVMSILTDHATRFVDAGHGNGSFDIDKDAVYFAIPERMTKVLPGNPKIVFTGEGVFKPVMLVEYVEGKLPVMDWATLTRVSENLVQISHLMEIWPDNFNRRAKQLMGYMDQVERDATSGKLQNATGETCKKMREVVLSGMSVARKVADYIYKVCNDYVHLQEASFAAWHSLLDDG